MKKFHFAPTYFHKQALDDSSLKIRISIRELPSIDISEEDYSLRIETRHEDPSIIHREYAIEHHSKQEKHNYPHLQFKFHTEEIGTFWIHLAFKDSSEYEMAIKGFIYKIKGVLEDLERLRPGIADELMKLDEVDKLEDDGNFLIQKIHESLQNSQIEFKDSGNTRGACRNLGKNPLLLEFLGKENVQKIVTSCSLAAGKH